MVDVVVVADADSHVDSSSVDHGENDLTFVSSEGKGAEEGAVWIGVGDLEKSLEGDRLRRSSSEPKSCLGGDFRLSGGKLCTDGVRYTGERDGEGEGGYLRGRVWGCEESESSYRSWYEMLSSESSFGGDVWSYNNEPSTSRSRFLPRVSWRTATSFRQCDKSFNTASRTEALLS